jgi:hypothetical protein
MNDRKIGGYLWPHGRIFAGAHLPPPGKKKAPTPGLPRQESVPLSFRPPQHIVNDALF